MACIGVHCGGKADLERGMRGIHCLTKRGATDTGRGFRRALDIVGCIPPGLENQAGSHMPFMGTNGGDPSFREFPYSVGRVRKGSPEFPTLATRAAFCLINH